MYFRLVLENFDKDYIFNQHGTFKLNSNVKDYTDLYTAHPLVQEGAAVAVVSRRVHIGSVLNARFRSAN